MRRSLRTTWLGGGAGFVNRIAYIVSRIAYIVSRIAYIVFRPFERCIWMFFLRLFFPFVSEWTA